MIKASSLIKRIFLVLIALLSLAAIGHEGAKQLETYWVGQGIGLVNETITAGQTVQKFKEEFIDSYERVNGFFSDD